MQRIYLFLMGFFLEFCRLSPVKGGCSTKIPDMACIPAGEFLRGYNMGLPEEQGEALIFVDSFYIDLFEVTNADFEECVKAGGCLGCLANKTCSYVGARYGKPYQRPRQPAIGIPWYAARDYCAFVGKRLPTESEWEKAARGENGELYPWGNDPPNCTRAVIEENGRKGCATELKSPAYLMTTQDVGSRPPGRYGLYDMAGNAWEWVLDWFSPYQSCGEVCFEKNPRGPCRGAENCPGFSHKVLKGGSWWWPAEYTRGSYRRHNDPGFWEEYHHFGFRCAKDSY
ncbi:MAG: formylglycine-generating enzyme family protein [Leptospiraceae bacterium]|nr:formylglycine-generating enzyme family protein [Leptospiraceae bacterium]MDW8306168.1 SUMF1/EgtB/PvdO family nonheme iron enzyme [Leptospiraceae bacterium]